MKEGRGFPAQDLSARERRVVGDVAGTQETEAVEGIVAAKTSAQTSSYMPSAPKNYRWCWEDGPRTHSRCSLGFLVELEETFGQRSRQGAVKQPTNVDADPTHVDAGASRALLSSPPTSIPVRVLNRQGAVKQPAHVDAGASAKQVEFNASIEGRDIPALLSSPPTPPEPGSCPFRVPAAPAAPVSRPEFGPHGPAYRPGKRPRSRPRSGRAARPSSLVFGVLGALAGGGVGDHPAGTEDGPKQGSQSA
ncbi:hypothetical protein DL768_005583 [Monosporascus sp. mg162]|nr:hypothetical protein DL768_005583 [Monosporascus sp. mg162]